MGKQTHTQRLDKSPQPFTVTQTDGNVLHIFGYTPERRLNESDQFELSWECHDLGQVATHEIAKQVAADWREGLVGLYPLD